MSSFDKTVKLACKPKAAPPKAKYLDPIIAATYSDDGSIHDVCRALLPRFREPNAIVVFKALIVLHTMIRNGSTDNVLSYLSSSPDVLRLHNVAAGQWEGYDAPQNLKAYAAYLDARIKAYKDLKHDPVRVQSDVNRDMRVEHSIEEDRARASGAISRSKTMTGRKLRVMTVDKGLLRETKAVQRVITALLECRFYLDRLEDELNISALRMLVKDLLVLFQALNEGVINVLEHYFEMSHVDAGTSLNIYKNFCKQTERVVEYLLVAKKLQNMLNVPIPNLKHAPVSLVNALEEYLNDPNFEQNRIEYRGNKAAADKSTKEGRKTNGKPTASGASSSKATHEKSPASNAETPAAKPATNQALVDFFSAIEEEQPTMFNPQTNSPTAAYFQQQAAYNPFAQHQAGPNGPFVQPFQIPQQHQPTGFASQQTPFSGPFNAFNTPQQSAQHLAPFAQQVQPQPTGFLQPQATGFNPFRQSMVLPQSTGVPPFGLNATSFDNFGENPSLQSNGPSPFLVSQPTATSSGPSQPSGPLGPFQTPSLTQAPFNSQPIGQPSALHTSTSSQTPFDQHSAPFGVGKPPGVKDTPQRSSTAPISGHSFKPSTLPTISEAQPVAIATHQTGSASRNPFGVPKAPSPPPVPKAPTLAELASGAFTNFGAQLQQQANGQAQPSQPQNSLPPQGADISSIASSFTFNNDWKLEWSKSNNTSALGASSLNSQTTSATTSDLSSAFSNQPTGSTTATTTPSISISPLQPQTTGFTPLKTFKPTSSFGASLFESLPPIPQASSTNDNASQINNPLPSTAPSLGGLNFSTTGAHSALGTQPTGFAASTLGGSINSPFTSSLGVGLRPQATGLAGAANPFRASMANPVPNPSFPSSPFPSTGTSTLTPNFTGAPPSFGANLFGVGAFGSNHSPLGANTPNQQQQQNGVSQASLI